MTWLRRKPSKEMQALNDKGDEIVAAEIAQQSALRRLMQKLDELPLDQVLLGLGRDLTGEKNGH